MDEFKPGISLEKTFTVKEEHTARFLGSGDVGVLLTPSMIAFMETTARLAVDPFSRGIHYRGNPVDAKHLAPAPKGAEIRVTAELMRVERRKLVFEVKAYWLNKLIGKGVHERFIVSREKFLEKVKSLKTSKKSS
ncbi:MAG: thioesterase [Thermoprotei archaeon]|nr:MAG: thioesterase [Thermoprotei archaeon]